MPTTDPAQQFPEATDSSGPRYIIGIDLGTTNSAVSYVDLLAPGQSPAIKFFQVPQLTDAGEFNPLAVLPSFAYLPGDYDIAPEAMIHPWPKSEDTFVGAWARDQGALVPSRLVSSAKSWLCHGNVDHNAHILPWGAQDEVPKISPVEASAAYLTHIRKAWNHSRGDEEELFLENQKVILTVPASFDEVARNLTLAAAEQAGYRNVTLLEEPLAAFYSWLARHEKQWQQYVQPGQLILICDVGGGTTDFTLVTLTATADGSPRFERIAVGDHLLLGGDNMDLTLARWVERQWHGGQRQGLETARWQALCHQCRQAKELILSDKADTHRITLMGSGSRLIGGTMTAVLTRDTVEQMIVEGFFPMIDEGVTETETQRAAISEFGLPYEPDPAITRHLLKFLVRHQEDVNEVVGKPEAMPDLVLFNGGALNPQLLQIRIIDALCRWSGCEPSSRPAKLDNPHHDLAVAQGAAYYGLVKVGKGVRVGSGSPRSYYLGIGQAADEDPTRTRPQAICLIERGLDEGSQIHLADRQFDVLTNQPVRFDLFSSSFRSRDRMGDMVKIDDTFMGLPPLQTVIQYGKKGVKNAIPVGIEAEYTEMGTLSLWCRSLISNHRWQLQFQLRDNEPISEVNQQVILEDELVRQARQIVKDSLRSNEPDVLTQMTNDIVTAVDLPRDKWPLTFLRDLGDRLLEAEKNRTSSPAHEARWLNLTGFCLRPGFGDSLDAERVKQVWKLHHQGAAFPKHPQVQSEWWIMWRRIAGGLTPGQQRQLSQTWLALLQPKKGKKLRLSQQHQIELWMAVANLERLYVKEKIAWGRLLLSELNPKQARHQFLWSLARIGARELLYGSTDRVIPPAEATRWIDDLLGRKWPQPKIVATALAQLARKTGDRTRDVPEAVKDRILTWMAACGEMDQHRRYLQEVIPIAKQEEQALFGESLPAGLVLRET